MKLVAVLILGIGIGFGLAKHQTVPPVASVAAAPPPSCNCHNTVQVLPAEPPVASESKTPRAPASQNQGGTESGSTSSVSKNPPFEFKRVQKVEVGFSSELLSQLEEQWNDLPNQVRLVREERGWRVMALEPASLFARVGLKVGDLITNESVEEMQFNEDTTAFHDRVVDLLDHVTDR